MSRVTQLVIKNFKEKSDFLLSIQRAPSQFAILTHLMSTGKTLTVKEVSNELSLTLKATERAMAKLLNKGLIQRSPFREGAYTCDIRQILLSLLLITSDINGRIKQ